MPGAGKMAELKPCPFCGGKVELKTQPDGRWSWYFVKCPNCLVGTEKYNSREAAARVWNRRAEPPNPPLTVEELRTLPAREWVWIESTEPSPYTNGSAYYCKIDAIRPEVMFECGYPGWGTAFRYEAYGKTWRAYRRRPEEEIT